MRGDMVESGDAKNTKLTIEVLQKQLAIKSNRLGQENHNKGNLVEALGYYQKALKTLEKLEPDSLDTAMVYTNMGIAYKEQGELEEALRCLQISLEIKKKLDPRSQLVANSYRSIGSVYHLQGKSEEALRYCLESLEISKKYGPDTLDIASIYSLMGLIYKSQGNLDKALEYCLIAMTIREKFLPKSLPDISASYTNMGSVCSAKGDLEKALEYFHRALKIDEQQGSDNLGFAVCCSNLGITYRAQNNLSEALKYCQLALDIMQKKLPPKHPELVALGYLTAKTAKDLKQYDLALSYADISLKGDPKYKFAHYVKGLIFQEQALLLKGQEQKDRLQQSLKSFDDSLACDSNYGDATLGKLKVEALLIKLEPNSSAKASKVQALRQEVSVAKAQENRRDNSYDQNKRLEYQQAFKGVEVKLPEPEFEIGTLKYRGALDEVLKQVSALEARTSATEARVDAVETRVSSLESRMDILEKKVYTLSDAMAMCQRSISDVDQRITDAKQSSSLTSSSTEHKSSTSSSNTNHLLEDLLIEKAKLEKRKSQIKSFHDNVDLRHFYFALLSELEAAYIAAQAMQSGKLSANKSTKFTTPAKYIATAISLAPIAGHLAATLIKGAGSVIDTYETAKTNTEFLSIRNIAATIEDFDKFALRVSVDLTLARQEEIMILEGKKVPGDWKKPVKSLLKGGLEKAMAEFVKTNDTEAKLRGRVAAHQVINYLQQDGVAEGLSFTDAIDVGKPTFKTSHSVAAMKVVKKITSPDLVEPSKSVSKASATNKSSCVIL